MGVGIPSQAALDAQWRRRRLIRFTADATPGYIAGWYHHRVCRKLEEFSRQVTRGESPRLMIWSPPRVGKSRMGSVCFPAWHLGHNPDHSIIQGSYGQDLSSKFSRQCRGLTREDFFKSSFPDFGLSRDANTAAHWETTKGGGYKAVGVGSAVTGHGAHILDLDDTTKNRQEAYSKLARDRVWEWWDWDISSRLAPGGGVVVTNTRWHHDDLSGRLIKRDGLKAEGGLWDVVEFPAIAIEDEHDEDGRLLRLKGEALHPERYPADCSVYQNAQRSPRVWSALFQQRPSKDEGDIFKGRWFKRWRRSTLPARFDEIIISVDATFKATKTGSFVVLQVWGRANGNAYLLAQERGRWSFIKTLARLIRLRGLWPSCGAVLIEDKANGPAIISTLRGKIPGLVPIEPDGSKEARAEAVSPWVESGNVYIPAEGEADWVEGHDGFLEECTTFPAAANDDQVDCMTQALSRFFGDGSSWLDNFLYGA